MAFIEHKIRNVFFETISKIWFSIYFILIFKNSDTFNTYEFYELYLEVSTKNACWNVLVVKKDFMRQNIQILHLQENNLRNCIVFLQSSN